LSKRSSRKICDRHCYEDYETEPPEDYVDLYNEHNLSDYNYQRDKTKTCRLNDSFQNWSSNVIN
jgi:hypothetical protein